MGLFSVLKYKNYRAFIVGQAMSNIGNMMQFVAVSWLAYKLTDSVFVLGVVSFSKQISGFFAGFFSGVIADRFNRKKLLQYAHATIGCLGILLAVLVYYNIITISMLIIIQIITGIIKAVEIPSRQNFVNDMITDKNLLSSAIALNSTVFNTARLVGPMVAGILIPLVGEASCLLVYGIMSFTIAVVFYLIKVPEQQKNSSKLNFKKEFFEGFTYAFSHPSIKTSLLFVGAFSFFGTSFIVLLPVIAGDVFNGGAEYYGFMNSAQGLGAIFGGIFLANKAKATKMPTTILWASVIFCVGVGIVSFSNIIYVAILGIVLTGLGRICVFASSNTLLQLLAEDNKRGRVLSLYITIFMGSMTLGGLTTGVVADYFGVMNALIYQTISSMIVSVFYMKNLKKIDVDEISNRINAKV